MKTHLELELEGHVYITEKDEEGKVVNKQQLDDNDVLKSILYLIDIGNKELEKQNDGIKR